MPTKTRISFLLDQECRGWIFSVALAGLCACSQLLFGQVPSNSPHPGVDALLRGDYDVAVAYFTEAIKRNPTNSRIYNDRGVAYKEKGELDKALSDYNEAILLDPNYAAAYSNRGILYLQKFSYDQALADFDRAIQLDSHYSVAFANRGKVYLAKGDYDRAISDASEAIQITPAKASIYKERGDVYLAKGDKEKAIADYDEATRLSSGTAPPSNPVSLKPPNVGVSNPSVQGVPFTTATTAESGMPDKITILGQELCLKEQKTEPDASFIAEYIPASNTWDDWTLLFAIRSFPGSSLEPTTMAAQKAAQILALKSAQPISNASAWKNVDGKSAMLDFIECSPDFNLETHSGFIEHNFWRYTKFDYGVVAYQIARRIYSSKSSSDDMLVFIKGIGPLRGSLTTEINNPQLPIPEAANGHGSPAPPLLTVPVKIGDDINTVKAELKTDENPQPEGEDSLINLHKSFIHAGELGIWVFFNQQGVVDTIRLEAPFGRSISGVKIGDAMKKVLATLGPPMRTPYIATMQLQAYLYPLDDTRCLRVDMNEAEGVHNFLIFPKNLPPLPPVTTPLFIPGDLANIPKISGSGAFLTSDGIILTAAHVIAGAKRIEILTGDMRVSAHVLKSDTKSDVALLQCSGNQFSPLPITSSKDVRLGQEVFTVGFPNVSVQGFDPKYTEGAISSADGLRDDPTKWQISVPIQSGNSGGPLCDENGNLVGIIVSTLDPITGPQLTSPPLQIVNYAVKSSYILPLLNGVKNLPQPRLPDAGRKKEDVVDAVRASAVLVLVY